METNSKNKHTVFKKVLTIGVQKIIVSIDSGDMYEFVSDNVEEHSDEIYPEPVPTEEEEGEIVEEIMSSKELRDSIEGLVTEYFKTMRQLLEI